MPSVAQMSLLAGKIIGDVGEDEDAVAEKEKWCLCYVLSDWSDLLLSFLISCISWQFDDGKL